MLTPTPKMGDLFQHTAARRRLPGAIRANHIASGVSTHSRPKAAAALMSGFLGVYMVSTHSRPKAAAFTDMSVSSMVMPFQHTAARRRLLPKKPTATAASSVFQHTAARRRLLAI